MFTEQPPTLAIDVPVAQKQVLTESEAAAYLRVSRSYLRQSRMNSKTKPVGPAYIRIGRAIRYTWEDLEAFLERNRESPS